MNLTNVVNADELEQILTPEEKAFEQQVENCVKILAETGLVTDTNRLVHRYCESKVIAKTKKIGRFANRMIAEKMTELNPFVITPHHPSYILPVTITDNFNAEPYAIYDLEGSDMAPGYFADNMSRVEAKYQVSFKVPLRSSSLFTRGDAIYFAMTIQAWWQLYSDEISKPFRETNYTPELIYMAPLHWAHEYGNFGYFVSFQHQSNGQVQGHSRSWNRIHTGLIYDTGNYTLMFKPWFRIKEEEKTSPFNPRGDDNPDIEDYLGHYEFGGAYAFNDEHKISTRIRKNWRTGNGSIEINYTYPFWGRLRGFAQYFSGYGESLVDYNHKQQKFGMGIALTDIF